MSFRINVEMTIIVNLDNGSTLHQGWLLRPHMSCSPARQKSFFFSGGTPLKIYVDIIFAIFESRDTLSNCGWPSMCFLSPRNVTTMDDNLLWLKAPNESGGS